MAARYEIAIDGRCGFCKRSAGWLKALDWANHVRIRPVDEPGMPEMRVTRLRDGKTLGGFDGFRMMAHTIPALMVAWPLLYVPPVPPIGRRIYRWVAHNRAHMPGGCDSDSCELPAPPKP